MGDMDIAFPNLGIYLRNVPKTIMIGNFDDPRPVAGGEGREEDGD